MKNIGTKLSFTVLALSFQQIAAAACIGITCEGKDPAVEGCGQDAVVVATTHIMSPNAINSRLATLELKWSQKCQANWAKLWTSNQPVFGASLLLKSASVVNTTRGITQTYTADRNYLAISSPMTYGLGQCAYAKGVVRYYSSQYDYTWYPATSTRC